MPLTESHLNQTLAWVNDPAMMRLLGRTAHVEPEEHRDWFAAMQRRADCRYFAVEVVETGRHIGNVWLWDIDTVSRKAEIRILFGDETSRGRGYGGEAIDLVARVAFDSLGLHRVYAYVFAINPRAKRAFERAGLRAEGLLRHHRIVGTEPVDVHLLARLDTDPPPR